jgi:hypothetical protein
MPIARAQVASTKPQTITSWSYSRLRDWLSCGFYAKCKFIDKMKEPGNKAMQRGGDIHKDAQKYVEAKTQPRIISDELRCFEAEFKMLRKVKALCESEWAFTKLWAPTGWFDEDCWLRVKMDVHWLDAKANVLHVVDHKTGKVAHPEKYKDQEELYALGGLLQYPDADGVWVKFWYLDAGVVGSSAGNSDEPPKGKSAADCELGAYYPRSEVERLKKKWARAVAPMMKDTVFRPRPEQRKCEYCPFSKKKGGPCKF